MPHTEERRGRLFRTVWNTPRQGDRRRTIQRKDWRLGEVTGDVFQGVVASRDKVNPCINEKFDSGDGQSSDSFEGMAAVFERSFILTRQSNSTELDGMIVTANLFETLGLTAEHGRTFASEDVHGGPVVVLGHNLWQQRFGGRTDTVGSFLTLNGKAHRVIGILPQRRGLRILHQSEDTELYALLHPGEPSDGPHENGPVAGIARLKPTMSLAAARAELSTIEQRLDAQFSDSPEGYDVHLANLQADNTRTVRASLLIFAGATGRRSHR